MINTNWNPSRRELRQFAGIWLPAFGALAGAVVALRTGAMPVAYGIWGTAATLSIAGLALPGVARAIWVAWMAAAYPIGWTISHVVLGVLFFGLFSITGLIMRAVGYDPLRRRRQTGSLWVVREARKDPAAYFRQF